MSIEPQNRAYAALKEKTKSDEKWICYEHLALGPEFGVTSLNVARNSVSSSLRTLSAIHLNADPHSVVSRTEPVQIVTLDSIFDEVVVYGD